MHTQVAALSQDPHDGAQTYLCRHPDHPVYPDTIKIYHKDVVPPLGYLPHKVTKYLSRYVDDGEIELSAEIVGPKDLGNKYPLVLWIHAKNGSRQGFNDVIKRMMNDGPEVKYLPAIPTPQPQPQPRAKRERSPLNSESAGQPAASRVRLATEPEKMESIARMPTIEHLENQLRRSQELILDLAESNKKLREDLRRCTCGAGA